ncbi:hypothetical protein ABIC32_001475 [Brevundimonas sp. 1080]|uniref:hypothetical protein n=1 Tax=Brevundimonas sp. 1080 TaxID=3156405 RepID=UPI00339249B8
MMLYAWVDGVSRPPLSKGERTTCRDCGGLLTSVVPVENVRHWRHKAGDCDSWSEPEGPWHLGWKEQFDLECREIGLVDALTGERHRADVLCGAGTPQATVLELQHSSISADEQRSRENFYQQAHRMFWLVHIHSEANFNGYSFGFSLDFGSRPVVLEGHTYGVMRWMGRSKQFIEKWKRAKAHVFFDYQGHVFYLASESVSLRLGGPFKKGEFALCVLTHEQFMQAVKQRDFSTLRPNG